MVDADDSIIGRNRVMSLVNCLVLYNEPRLHTFTYTHGVDGEIIFEDQVAVRSGSAPSLFLRIDAMSLAHLSLNRNTT